MLASVCLRSSTPVARQRRDHEGVFELHAVIGGLGQRQQLFARDQVDLVQHQDFRMLNGRKLAQDRIRLLVETCLGVEQHADEIGIMRPLHAVDTMARSSRRFGAKMPGVSTRMICAFVSR